MSVLRVGMKRREWLTRIGAMGLAALVPQGFARAVRADDGDTAPVRRLLVFWTPNGTVMDAFWPGDGSLGTILEPLRDWEERLAIVRGLDLTVATRAPVAPDHLPDIRAALTGRQAAASGERWVATGESIDQYLAGRLGTATRFGSLELGVQPVDRLCYRGRDAPVQPSVDPVAAFERIFGDLLENRADAARRRALRGSILDGVGEELRALEAVMSAEERVMLQAHQDAVRSVEQSITAAPPSMQCDPDAPKGGDWSAPEAFPEVGRQMMDVASLALACDLTRVLTIQWSGGASQVVHSWAGVDTGHHSAAHQLGLSEGQAREHLINIERWYAEQFGSLLARLAAAPAAGGGSVLDETVVVWAHEQSHGASHSRLDMPYVLAGAVAGGKRLDYGGVPHNLLLVTLCHLMGFEDVSHFGDEEMPAGVLTGLSP